MLRSAKISDCGTYRYRLERETGDALFGGGRGAVNFVMLNPSTADAEVDDPTIRRCTRYASDWGFQRLIVTNLYALRATDPSELWRHPDPVGPENDAELLAAAREADKVVCAWGSHGTRNGRSVAVGEMLFGVAGFLYALRWTKGGEPCHPLYLPADLQPKPFVLGKAA